MFAKIIDNVAIDVSANPTESFHPDVAAEFVNVPDIVEYGWRLINGEWVAPEVVIVPEVAIEPKEVDPITFKLLFTSAERVAAKALRASDPAIDDFWTILDDPRTRTVDMRIPSIQAIIEYTLTACNVGNVAERKAQILQGIIQ